MKNKFSRISLPILISTAVIAPVATLISCGSNSDDFKDIVYKGHSFKNSSELLDYIKANSKEEEFTDGQKLFTVEFGPNVKNFKSYEEAIKEVDSKITSKEVYLKPGVSFDQAKLGNEISSDNFIDKANTETYVVFEKSSGMYSFAPKSKPDEVKRAREDAVLSFIQVHNAYQFDGKYFHSTTELELYLRNEYSINPRANILNTPNGDKAIVINGFPLQIKVDNSGQIDAKDLKDKISSQIKPYWNNGTSNVLLDANNIDQGYLSTFNPKAIQIVSNGDQTTQIVDMDSSTPNGNLYGSYYINSGMGIDGVSKTENWNQVEQSPQAISELKDIEILKSTMVQLLKSQGVDNLLDIFNSITISKDGDSLSEYLQGLGSQNDNKVLRGFLEFQYQISKGSRYNFLDGLISSYKYLINYLIQEKYNTDIVVNVAKYFESISEYLDASLYSRMILPFTGDQAGSDPLGVGNFHYFKTAFSFYTENNGSPELSFQSNPYASYRKLIGNAPLNSISGTTVEDINKNYFGLIKAASGYQAIIARGLKQNDDAFNYWLLNDSYDENFKFTTDKNDAKNLQDFSFKFVDSNAYDDGSDEWNGIWRNLKDVNLNVESTSGGKISVLNSDLWNNFKHFLKTQNTYISKYQEKVTAKIASSKTRIFTSKEFEEFKNNNSVPFGMTLEQFAWSSSEIGSIRKNISGTYDIFGELDGIDASSFNDTTTADSAKHLEAMVSSAIKPLEERIKNFTSMATGLVAQIASTVAGAMTTGGTTTTITRSYEATEKIRYSARASSNVARTTKLDLANSNAITLSQIEKTRMKESGSFRSSLELKEKTVIKTNSSDIANKLKNIADKINANSKQIANGVADGILGGLESFVMDSIKSLPIIGSLFNFISGFSSSERQIYEYAQSEAGTSLYWDGGLVEYSWWGLSSNQKYSIKDLKMIDTQTIISGYAHNEFYSDGQYYEDLTLLRYKQARESISNLSKDTDNGHGITWGIKVGDSGELIAGKTLKKLVAKLQNRTIDVKDIYTLANGFKTLSSQDAFNSSLQDLLNKIQPSILIRLPHFDTNGFLESLQAFDLPFPRYQASKQGILTTLNTGSANDQRDTEKFNSDFIVFDPNIDPQKVAATLKPYADNINKITGNKEELKALLLDLSKDWKVHSLDTIFEDINSNLHVNFGDFNGNNYLDNPSDIYLYSSPSTGQEHFFLNSRRFALNALMSELKISRAPIVNSGKKYVFENMVFSTITDIYNYVKNNQDNKGGNNA